MREDSPPACSPLRGFAGDAECVEATICPKDDVILFFDLSAKSNLIIIYAFAFSASLRIDNIFMPFAASFGGGC